MFSPLMSSIGYLYLSPRLSNIFNIKKKRDLTFLMSSLMPETGTVSKETYYSVKRDLLQSEKRPTFLMSSIMPEKSRPMVFLS
jgi:hypothetical protein